MTILPERKRKIEDTEFWDYIKDDATQPSWIRGDNDRHPCWGVSCDGKCGQRQCPNALDFY